MNILVTGSNGTVGSELIRQAIANKDIHKVYAMTRKPVDFSDEKVEVILHKDFLNYETLSDLFRKTDACIWCLGVPQNRVNEQQYHEITYTYALNAAQEMLRANPSITFLFCSGAGADTKETSRILFAREKGKTENALLKLPFKTLFIARPAAIKPNYFVKNAPWSYHLVHPMYWLLNRVIPSYFITTRQLALAFLYLVTRKEKSQLLHNADLLKMYERSTS